MTMQKKRIGRKRGKKAIKFREGRQTGLQGEIITDHLIDESVKEMVGRRRKREKKGKI